MQEGQAKMSKSDPDSAIFMEDTPDDVVRKIKQAYCPSKPKADRPQADGELRLVVDELENPCLDYVKNIVFSAPEAVFKAGGKEYRSFEEVEKDFLDGHLGEEPLKDSLAVKVNELLEVLSTMGNMLGFVHRSLVVIRCGFAPKRMRFRAQSGGAGRLEH
jgi:tyrosyl-tRNA synthetase